ncbi:MAG TPA: efflux RND transporter periplasmic adaptor subunit [Burkholderiales bacterium]|nr:efflux RND transporter periplasmic adaptor subunit [Burkholderiales bacterium]
MKLKVSRRAPARPYSAGIAGLAVCLLAASLSACSEKQSSAAEKKTGGGPAVPVIVASVATKTVPLRVQAIGNVESYATVSVKARVDGQIVKVFFADGQEVATGQPLFQLDPRPFEALLQQAEAALQRDKAQLERARVQEERYKDLLQKNFVSPDAYAQFRTNVDTAQATVRADEAAVENARLQVEYTTIRSPITGRTGKIMIQLGNMVKANDTGPLVVINQITPVYLSFAVPEQYLAEIRKYMAERKLPVEARLPDSVNTAATGELAFIDNAVDATTGTVKLRAVFENKDRALWPGQFVTASLTLREQHDAVVVPSQAVQTGPKGTFVFVVKPELTAEMRDVVVERVDGEQTLIAKGLAPGERVVTTGQSRLVPGIKVVPKPS